MSEYERIYAIVRSIPKGRVANYGQVALLAGKPRWARVVGRVMAACSDPTVPCHRVVYRDGSLATSFGLGGRAEQRALLQGEGVAFLPDGRVDMACCGWRG